MKFDPAKELEDFEVLKLIRDIIESGTIIYSNHVKKQMAKRGYQSLDVTYILTEGKVESKNFDEEKQNWVYKIEGKDLDGDSGGVVTAIITRWRIEIITVLS